MVKAIPDGRLVDVGGGTRVEVFPGVEEIRRRLNLRVLQSGMSLREVAAQMSDKFPHQRVSAYLSGETVAIPVDFVAEFCLVVPTDVTWLVLGVGVPAVDPPASSAEVALGEITRALDRYRRSSERARGAD